MLAPIASTNAKTRSIPGSMPLFYARFGLSVEAVSLASAADAQARQLQTR